MHDLHKLAERIELYSQRDNIRQALRHRDFAAAIEGCKLAMREAHYRAKYNCAPIGPQGHVRNFEAIKSLRSQLSQTTRQHTHPG